MKKIGKYEVQRELGRGAMAVVYEAVDTAIERTVAIKVIAEGLLEGEEARRRFYQEARSAGRLSHENILVIYDLGEDGGHPFIAMEHLRGTDLRRQLDGSGPPSLERTLDIAAQVARGLEYAHQNGVIHRDIKPSNICLTQTGRVKIMDFGIAKLVSAEMTRTGQTLGTPYYMAPEQVQGAKIDGRADIFAFGVVLYELLTGVRPFEGGDMASVLYKVVFKPPPPLPDRLPAALKRVVERCLAKDPEQRYPDFSAVLADLETLRKELIAAEEVQETVAALDRAPRPASAPAPATVHQKTRYEPAPPAPEPRTAEAPTFDQTVAPSARRAVRPALLIAGAAGILAAAAAIGLLVGRAQPTQSPPPTLDQPQPAAATVPQPTGGAGAETQAKPTVPASPAAQQATSAPPPTSAAPAKVAAAPKPSDDLVKQVERQAATFKREVDSELAQRTAPADLRAAADFEEQLLDRARRGDAAVLGELPRLGQRFKRVQAQALLAQLHTQVLGAREEAAQAQASEHATETWNAAERSLRQADALRSRGNLRGAGASYLEAEPLYREAAERAGKAAAEAQAQVLASALAALDRNDPDAALAALKSLPPAELERPKTAALLARIEQQQRASAPVAASAAQPASAPGSAADASDAPRPVAPKADGSIPVSIRLPNVVGVRRVTLYFGSLGTGKRPNRRIMKSVGDDVYSTELTPEDIGPEGVSYEIQVQTVNGSYIADRREIRPRR